MGDLFTALTHAVEGAPALALASAFAWGILSVVLSPCHLAGIPLIVAFIGGQGPAPPRRALVVSTAFSVGILITIALVGLVTAAAGRVVGDIGAVGSYVVAAIFIVVGLHLLDVLPMPWSAPGQVRMKRRGAPAAFALGLVFGIALGPCTFAFMAPLLGVTLAVGSASLAYGAVLLLAYGIGHCAVIVIAGTFTGVVQRYLNWSERSRGALILRRVCGGLVILGGVYLIYAAPQ